MSIRKRTTYVLEQGFELTLEPIEESVSIKETPDGYEVRYLTRDEMAESPDEMEDDNLFLVNYHQNFHITRDEIITEEEVKQWYHREWAESNGKNVDDIPYPSQVDSYWFFPLSCLVHSEVWLSLNHFFACDSGGWDTSHVGVVLVSRKETEDEGKAHHLAEGLIKEWNEYLNGDVYCTVVEKFDQEKKPLDYDVVGGCYGYEYALGELKGV